MDARAAHTLNQKIAEQVYGLTPSIGEGYVTYESENGPYVLVSSNKIDSHPKAGLMSVPMWATDMVWAWRLVDRFTAQGFHWKLEQRTHSYKPCLVSVFDGLIWHTGFASTMPEAICKMALLIVERGLKAEYPPAPEGLTEIPGEWEEVGQ
jgi:hypothetical protein